MLMPPSPWIGSIMMAAVSSSISLRHGVQIAERSVDEAGHQRARALRDTSAGPWRRSRPACGRESRPSKVMIL